jgi:hypothetical protein
VSGHGLSDKDDLPVPVVRPRVARRLPAKCYQTKHRRMGLLTSPDPSYGVVSATRSNPGKEEIR